MAEWRVEHWTISGVHTGYRVVRGFGFKLEIGGGFPGGHTPGAFEKAEADAEALCASLNGKVIGQPV
jgi:hypothetical protein